MVNWSCVYNVKDYGGSFDKAQKAATSGGGGVVYFPPGTYSFQANIMIESNVVIRDEPTTEIAKKGIYPSPGSPSPKTVFKCIFGTGQNKVIIGNNIHDVTYQHPDPADTSSNIIWPWRFSTAIACYSDGNALVANNLISKSTTSMKTTITLDEEKMTVPYLVDNRYGIDVNQILLGAGIRNYMGHKCPSQLGTLTPSCFPWYFQKRLVIRGNCPPEWSGWCKLEWR